MIVVEALQGAVQIDDYGKQQAILPSEAEKALNLEVVTPPLETTDIHSWYNWVKPVNSFRLQIIWAPFSFRLCRIGAIFQPFFMPLSSVSLLIWCRRGITNVIG